MGVVTRDLLAAEVRELLAKICEQTKIGPLSDIKMLVYEMLEADLISKDDLKYLRFIHQKTPL